MRLSGRYMPDGREESTSSMHCTAWTHDGTDGSWAAFFAGIRGHGGQGELPPATKKLAIEIHVPF